MKIGFYELKYRVIEMFYDSYEVMGKKYLQTYGFVIDYFDDKGEDSDLRNVIVIITAILRVLKHNAFKEGLLGNVINAIKTFESHDFRDKLNEEEYEVLCEEITEVKLGLKALNYDI